MCQVEATQSAGFRFYTPCHNPAVYLCTWWPPALTHIQFVTGGNFSQGANCFGELFSSGSILFRGLSSSVAFWRGDLWSGGFCPGAFCRGFWPWTNLYIHKFRKKSKIFEISRISENQGEVPFKIFFTAKHVWYPPFFIKDSYVLLNST